MQKYSVAIVGAGPRGLGIIERISAIYAESKPDWSLQIDLVDPNEPGQGAHPSFQPDHLITNTVAGQITMFSDFSVKSAGPIVPGPSLLDWARAAGYRRVNDRYVITMNDGDEINENDYLPRAMLGEYLTYVYDILVKSLPKNISVTHHRMLAQDIKQAESGRFLVEIEGGYCIEADHVVLSTGHSENAPADDDVQLQNSVQIGKLINPKLQFLQSINPIKILKSVSSNATVGIQGMGLTAYDCISELTVGRGGTFVRDGGARLKYEPSGREPKIIAFSRQSIPFSARGVNQKGIGGLHFARFFTRQWLDLVKQEKLLRTGSKKLDFIEDLWPTLRKEMCFAYSSSLAGNSKIDPITFIPSTEHEEKISKLLFPFGATEFENEFEFTEAVLEHTRVDLKHALGGNIDDPVKAATDVLRDVRDFIRYAVDYGGLVEESHKNFLNEIVPNMYRVAAGAPKERNMELLALAEAGLLTFGPGQRASLTYDQSKACFVLHSTRLKQQTEKKFDVLIKARIDSSVYPDRQNSKLIQNLLRRGTIRPYMNGSFHPGGLDIDESQNIINKAGQVQPNLWALGILVEGPNYCTYVLPRAQVNSRFIQFSGRCALKIIGIIEAQHASFTESQRTMKAA
jgi:uncharacterized NAD(P)/FAD-binding protein YdhS